MDYKEKYEEAFERAKDIYNDDPNSSTARAVCEQIFPELEESEDEKIRKEILNVIHQLDDNTTICGRNYDFQKWISWLEKQDGITKLSEEEKNRFAKCVLTSCAMAFIDYLDEHKYEGKMCVSNGECEDIENALHNGMFDRLHRYYCKYIEKQGEQKTIDKVEPKFKVGDWIINSQGMLRHIVDVDKTGYQTDKGWLTHDSYEREFHLWTIQDAKDGDVLTTHISPEGDWIGIYKQSTDDTFNTYCFLNAIGELIVNPNRCKNHGTHGLHPATKEQRDFLFQKMKEAGYEWDAEKGELKKWTEEPDHLVSLDKVCDWLLRGGYFINNTETIDDFRKAMEV